MSRIMHGLLVVYILSLTTSIAGHSLMTVLLLLGVIYLAVTKKIQFVSLGPDKALWLFWGVVALGAVFISVLPSHLRLTVVGEVRWILLLYMLVAVLFYLRPREGFYVRVLFITSTVVAVYACIQAFTGITLFRSGQYASAVMGGVTVWRAKGFYGNPMDFTYTIGTVLCLAVAGLISGFYKGRERLHVVGTVLVLGAALVLTFTRGAWLGALLAVSVMVVMYGRRYALKYFLVLGVVLGTALVVSPVLRERVYSIYDEGSDKSVSQRYDLWRANWAMFKDHPWLGVGYGQNSKYVQEYHVRLMGHEGFVGNAHNNFLQVLAGAGIFGFLLWLYFCGYYFWLAFRVWWRARGTGTWAEFLGLGAVGAQIFFHFGGLTQATFFDNEPFNMMILVWALLSVYRAGGAGSGLSGVADGRA